MKDFPIVGITMGDPAGIGPEIIAKALADHRLYKICRPVVLGDPEILASACSIFSKRLSLNIISSPLDSTADHHKIDFIALSDLKKNNILPGRPTVEGGRAMVEYIIRAVNMAINGELDAMVTCPISKVLMHRAGYEYEGHTQLISHLTETDKYVMMLAGDKLRVALVTIHMALRDVPDTLNREMVVETIEITARAMKEDLGFNEPKIAVAALNPHAGESGLFGSEEENIIGPAVKNAMEKGIKVYGPLPADTLFHKAAERSYEAVVAMYHDQGLIPLKLLHFSDAVNVTLGLPIIRTSVDHGTAYDIAGTGVADESSLKAAITMAALMFTNRKRSKDI